MKKRGTIAIEELLKWVLGLIVFVIIVISIIVLSGKGQGAIDYIQNLFRFGK